MQSKAKYTRPDWIATVGAASLFSERVTLPAKHKPMRGVFMILATPYTKDKAIDYEDLAAEVDFLDRCGVQWMVWPQHASDLNLTKSRRDE